ncbi:MAG: peptidase dimerization domain-containing protein [Gemmatimonadetes bacterium]|nr:peptidase dimerization domain-containing protein [Gemmatimonadota bacterium]
MHLPRATTTSPLMATTPRAHRTRHVVVALLASLAFLSTAATAATAQELSGRAAREAARTYREANEAAILREFTTLLSLPNVASDSVNIRRNAALLLEMLRKRGATNTQLLEEAGSGHLKAILQKYKTLLKGDAWLFCDGPVHQGGDQQLVFGLRGVTGLEVTVYGPTRPLHSGHYGNWAPNPGMLLAHLVASLRSDDGEILIPGFYADVRPLSAAERKAVAGLPLVDTTLRRSLGLAKTEGNNALLAERIMRPALNLRGLRVGGVQELGSNTISTEAFASFDFRLVPNQTPARVRELVEKHLRTKGWHLVSDTPSTSERLTHPRIARLQWESGYPAQRAHMDDPFSRALVTAVSDGARTPPLLVPTLGGSGPSYLFTEVLGVPVVTLPIANADNNQHAANENLRVQNLWNAIEMYAGLMARLGKEWGGPPVP